MNLLTQLLEMNTNDAGVKMANVVHSEEKLDPKTGVGSDLDDFFLECLTKLSKDEIRDLMESFRVTLLELSDGKTQNVAENAKKLLSFNSIHALCSKATGIPLQFEEA